MLPSLDHNIPLCASLGCIWEQLAEPQVEMGVTQIIVYADFRKQSYLCLPNTKITGFTLGAQLQNSLLYHIYFIHKL
jgi:hypothetical protein